MNELTSIGVILLAALLAGHLVKYLRIPEVTGYIAVGAVVGPSMLGWVSHENVAALRIFSEVALALILFSIGSTFEISRLHRIGRSVVRLVSFDALFVLVAMTLVMKVAGQGWSASILLGIIAVETAAASTLMVLREMDASGPMTEKLISFLAVNNILCLTLFSITAGLLQFTTGGESTATPLGVLLGILWQLFGSAALGYLVGLLLAAWSDYVKEHGEMLILISGCMLLTVGASILLELSPLVASVTVGAASANLARDNTRVINVLGQTDPPFYVIFFVVAGASLHLAELKSIGVLGVLYVIVRGAAKLMAARVGNRGPIEAYESQKYFGVAMLSHAGLAIGIVLALNKVLPEIAPAVSTIVLAAVLVYEIAGPVLARWAIVRSGEAAKEPVVAPETQLT